MKDGIIIQARTGSTRLHNKILLPFYGEQRIIDILIENIRRACPDKQVILATTVRPQETCWSRWHVGLELTASAAMRITCSIASSVPPRRSDSTASFESARTILSCVPILSRRSLTLSIKNLPITLLMALPMGGLPSSLTWGCLLSSPRKKRCVALPCLRRKTLYRTRHDLSLYSSRRLSRQIVASARRIGRTIRLAFHAGYNGRFPVASASLCRVVRADRP